MAEETVRTRLRRALGSRLAQIGVAAFIGGWIAAIFSDGAARGVSVAVLVGGLLLGFVGGKIRRDSRRLRISQLTESADPGPANPKLSSSSIARGEYGVSIVGVDDVDYTDGLFEVAGDGIRLLMGGSNVRVGDEDWILRVRRGSVSLLRVGREVATAQRVDRRDSVWDVEGDTYRYAVRAGADLETEKSRSSIHVWAKDVRQRHRRNALVTASTGGSPTVSILFTYDVESKLTKRWGGDRRVTADFVGRVTVDSPVPIPVVVLALRLGLGRWAKRTPRVGSWTEVPSSGA